MNYNDQPYLSTAFQALLERLTSLFPKKESLHKTLYEAAHYSLHSPGKLLRPLFVLATAESLGCEREKALDPACAIECIHTYSLIHDDLPCMDDDSFRRGRPSLHKAFDESTALLAGNFLLTGAFELLSKAPYLSAEQKIALIHSLSKRSGAEGLLGGQVADLLYEGKEIDENILMSIHLNKTASLFIACMEFGAIIAEASETVRLQCIHFGTFLGLAYQMADDIEDESIALSLFGHKQAKKKRDDYFHKALSYLPDSCHLVKELALLLKSRWKESP